jgi:hypothetical protein
MYELSGLVAIDNGYLTVNDSNDDTSAMKIFRLDNQCKLTSSTSYPSGSPARDPEDLAMAPDGTVWVADIGDNDSTRNTMALWKLAPNSKTPVIHRLTYPDGAHDAETLLIGSSGVPVIVTKSLGKPASIYVPSAELVPNSQAGVPLKKVGEFAPPPSETPGGVGPPGRLVVTGGAVSPDGKRVVLRTYNDAFEWDVPDGDLVKAITTGKPRATPLPNEPQGESITYTRDGASFVTVSDVARGKSTPLLRYTPAAPAPTAPAKSAGPASNASKSSSSGLTFNDITYLVAAVGVLGLVLVIIGVIAIRRSRVRAAAAANRGAGGGAGSKGATAAAFPQRDLLDDDPDDFLDPPGIWDGRDPDGGMYDEADEPPPPRARGGGRGRAPRGADDRLGVVEAAPHAGSGPVSPAEPPTYGRGRRPSGRAGGAVYGARRDAQSEPPDHPRSTGGRRY